ncbi:tetratricopeptide repeat protein [Lentisphaerota bacterium ZTH]|nr:tetratricopeptide repeat protein [Lentisphaerota bacterium]WET07709.1 tetratricopeptide repeat protein [Lentisphaerota bacterium ZTH]
MIKKTITLLFTCSMIFTASASEYWQAVFNDATSLYNGKRYQEAYTLFKSTVSKATSPTEKYKSYMSCAHSAYALKKHTESLRYIDRAIAVKGISDDQETRAYYYKLIVTYNVNKQDNAEAIAEIIAKNKPFCGSLLGASMYFSSYDAYLKKDYEKALKLADVGIELSKPNTTYYYLNTIQQVRCLRKMRKFNEAFKLAEDSDLKEWPCRYLGELFYEIGYCCYLKKDFTRALKFFKRSEAIHECDFRKTKAVYFGALSRKELKKYPEAEKSFRAILDMADSPKRYKYRAQFHIADIYFILQNYESAVTEFAKVVPMECVTIYWKSRSMLMQGEALWALGKEKEAKAIFASLLKMEGVPAWITREAKKHVK